MSLNSPEPSHGISPILEGSHEENTSDTLEDQPCSSKGALFAQGDMLSPIRLPKKPRSSLAGDLLGIHDTAKCAVPPPKSQRRRSVVQPIPDAVESVASTRSKRAVVQVKKYEAPVEIRRRVNRTPLFDVDIGEIPVNVRPILYKSSTQCAAMKVQKKYRSIRFNHKCSIKIVTPIAGWVAGKCRMPESDEEEDAEETGKEKENAKPSRLYNSHLRLTPESQRKFSTTEPLDESSEEDVFNAEMIFGDDFEYSSTSGDSKSKKSSRRKSLKLTNKLLANNELLEEGETSTAKGDDGDTFIKPQSVPGKKKEDEGKEKKNRRRSRVSNFFVPPSPIMNSDVSTDDQTTIDQKSSTFNQDSTVGEVSMVTRKSRRSCVYVPENTLDKSDAQTRLKDNTTTYNDSKLTSFFPKVANVDANQNSKTSGNTMGQVKLVIESSSDEQVVEDREVTVKRKTRRSCKLDVPISAIASQINNVEVSGEDEIKEIKPRKSRKSGCFPRLADNVAKPTSSHDADVVVEVIDDVKQVAPDPTKKSTKLKKKKAKDGLIKGAKSKGSKSETVDVSDTSIHLSELDNTLKVASCMPSTLEQTKLMKKVFNASGIRKEKPDEKISSWLKQSEKEGPFFGYQDLEGSIVQEKCIADNMKKRSSSMFDAKNFKRTMTTSSSSTCSSKSSSKRKSCVPSSSPPSVKRTPSTVAPEEEDDDIQVVAENKKTSSKKRSTTVSKPIVPLVQDHAPFSRLSHLTADLVNTEEKDDWNLPVFLEQDDIQKLDVFKGENFPTGDDSTELPSSSETCNIEQISQEEAKSTAKSMGSTPYKWYKHALKSLPECCNLSWTEALKPNSTSTWLGDESVAQQAFKFVNKWKKRVAKEMEESTKKKKSSKYDSDSDYEEDESEEGLSNPLILCGPSGVGKTALIHAIAKQLEMKVLEVHAGDKRGANSLKTKLSEAGQSKRISTSGSIASFFGVKKPESSKETSISQTLIVLEEVDVYYNQDDNFFTTIKSLAAEAKVPVIWTCTRLPDKELAKEPPLETYMQLDVYRQSTDLIADYLKVVCLALRNVNVDNGVLKHIVSSCHQDLRQSINTLQVWIDMDKKSLLTTSRLCADQPSVSSNDLNFVPSSTHKDKYSLIHEKCVQYNQLSAISNDQHSTQEHREHSWKAWETLGFPSTHRNVLLDYIPLLIHIDDSEKKKMRENRRHQHYFNEVGRLEEKAIDSLGTLSQNICHFRFS